MMNKIASAVVAMLCLMVAGCSARARTGPMSVTTDIQQKATTPLHGNVSVGEVFGGEPTNPLGTFEIGNEEFRGALEESLKSAGLQEMIKGDGKYLLRALLEKVDQPVIGITMTIRTHVRYTLIEKKSGKNVYKESISGEYTAKFSDSLWGPKRMQIATENAARDNIRTLIRRLLQLELSQEESTEPGTVTSVGKDLTSVSADPRHGKNRVFVLQNVPTTLFPIQVELDGNEIAQLIECGEDAAVNASPGFHTIKAFYGGIQRLNIINAFNRPHASFEVLEGKSNYFLIRVLAGGGRTYDIDIQEVEELPWRTRAREGAAAAACDPRQY